MPRQSARVAAAPNTARPSLRAKKNAATSACVTTSVPSSRRYSLTRRVLNRGQLEAEGGGKPEFLTPLGLALGLGQDLDSHDLEARTTPAPARATPQTGMLTAGTAP